MREAERESPVAVWVLLDTSASMGHADETRPGQARFAAARGVPVIEVPAELLGSGSVVIRATGRAGTTPAEAVNATPVTIEVADPP